MFPLSINSFSDRRFYWSAIGLSLVLSFVLFRLHGSLIHRVDQLRSEYGIDLDLSRHKAEHMQAYQTLIASSKLPEAKPLSSNAWIQVIQAMAADQKLSLQELKPTYQQEKGGRKKTNLLLAVECSVPDMVNFLYQIAKSDDFVYVEELTIQLSSERSDLVQAQMVLSQGTGE